MMEVDQQTLKILLDKLNRPVHISYIARYILKQEIDLTMKVINQLIAQGQVEESQFGQGYYVRKSS